MSKTIVQVNFEYHMALAEYEAINEQAAQPIAEVEGLVWKIFLIDEAAPEAGGLYLFENAASAEAYLNGPLITGLRQHPGITNVRVKLSNILETPTLVTRGPIGVPTPLVS
jgi:hypothetical protein